MGRKNPPRKEAEVRKKLSSSMKLPHSQVPKQLVKSRVGTRRHRLAFGGKPGVKVEATGRFRNSSAEQLIRGLKNRSKPERTGKPGRGTTSGKR